MDPIVPNGEGLLKASSAVHLEFFMAVGRLPSGGGVKTTPEGIGHALGLGVSGVCYCRQASRR